MLTGKNHSFCSHLLCEELEKEALSLQSEKFRQYLYGKGSTYHKLLTIFLCTGRHYAKEGIHVLPLLAHLKRDGREHSGCV